MLIITGVGRCGTSVVAKFFENMGFNLGYTHWDDMIHAGGEDSTVVWINRWMYACKLKYGTSSLFVFKGREHILDFKLQIVKDPRFTWPGVMEGWLKLRKDLRVLILTRPFKDVVASRKKMGIMSNDWQDPRKYTIERLQIDFSNFLNVLGRNNTKYTMISFPGILDEYDLFYKSLRFLGHNTFDKEKGRKVWEKTVNKKLVSTF